MVIQLDPRRVSAPSQSGNRNAQRGPRRAPQEDVYTPPTRAEVNYIPANESLATMVGSAIEAVRRGVYWDRGTIVNILV